ncbi:hypothetical protein [Leptospira sp. GIMC2001]|uniref:hypothetical protein n=1 Tax=Leptospira sp. GIMC2001 TaxID=1513297 RepID=UPI00234B4DE9|nr:hypothetical protein [Leptospira sp. GIMC2001]WCL48316.1 hypothetical protein O4O04_13500 [Leptospira sp. GIMC2001]
MKLFLLIQIVFLLTHCVSLSSPEPDSIEFAEGRQINYYKMSDKRNQKFLQEITGIQDKHQSFISSFSLRIDRVHPNKENFNADGKIWFLKETGQVKIQLMDNFFGMIFSEVLATPNQIQVKTAKENKIFTQPMDDLSIMDPSKGKAITIPFPVIYYAITGAFIEEFQANPSFFSPEERRTLVKKNGDEFDYFFEEGRLQSIEWTSTRKGMKAISKAEGKISIPPEFLATKIVELGSDKETVFIQTKLRSIQRVNPSQSVFKL